MVNNLTSPNTEQYFSPESPKGVTAARLRIVEQAIANEYYGALTVDPDLAINDTPQLVMVPEPQSSQASLTEAEIAVPDTIAGAEAIDEAERIISEAGAAAINEAENILTDTGESHLLDEMANDMYVDNLAKIRDDIAMAHQQQEDALNAATR